MSTRTFALTAGDQDVLAHSRVSAELAVAELIWNAIDADATEVKLDLERNFPGGPPVRLVVADDGHGIGPHEVDPAFAAHKSSMKSARRTSPGGRPMHGRNGRGRFRSFAIATGVRWRTRGEDELGNIAETQITLRIDRPTNGEVSILDSTGRSDSPTGTTVTLTLADSQKAARVGDAGFAQRLEGVLAATLLSSDAVVSFDGAVLNPAEQIDHQEEVEFPFDLSEHQQFDGGPAGEPSLVVIEWKPTVLRPTVYLCDEHGYALAEFEGARLPKAPGIDWTAYLRWEGFARNTVNEGDLQNSRAVFAGIVEPALVALAQHLRDRTELLTEDIIETWVSDGTYPYIDSPATIVDEAEQASFRELVSVARKVVPTDLEQRRLTLGMMQATFKESPDDALQVIAKIKGLDAGEVAEFRELLERTSLSRIISASKLLTNRVDFLRALDELLHGEDHRAEFLERDHLHKLVEKNPWIFGNEWALVRSEASLVSVLREHLKLLRPEDAQPVVADDVDRGGRRVDMLFAGSASEHRRSRRLVVELKRASLVLGREERDQIESYAQAVAGHPKFQGEVVQWDFWLLGTGIGNDIRPSIKKDPAGLFQEVPLDNGSSYRIWILSWSEILVAARETLEFFRAEIDYDPDVAVAVAGLRARYPEHLPPS